MYATRTRALLCLPLLAAMLCIGAQSAGAFQAVPEQENLEIPLRDLDLYSFRSPGVTQGRQSAEQSLASRYDSRWHVYSWNPQTGTPSYAYGSPASLAGSIANASELDNMARLVISSNEALLRADNDNLRLFAAENALGKWAGHYQQTYGGLDVWGGQVRVIFTEQGELILMGSDYYSGIAVDASPAIDLNMAEILAKSALPFNLGTDSIEKDGALLILPVPVSETEVSFHLVWRVRVTTADPVGTWVTHVDAHDGEILWRYNDIHFAYSGTTDSNVEPITYCDGSEQQTVPYLRISPSNQPQVYSDSNGDWVVPGGTGDRAVGADLYGPYCDTNNNGGAEAQYFGTMIEGIPHTITFDDGNSQQDERDVFDAVNDIHDFFQLFAPAFNLPNTRMTANVSNVGGLCPGNAWWNGTINFCAASGGFANTGEIEGVVHHEYGHGVQAAILGSQGSQGLGEGNGDIIANLITNDNHIGRGFNVGQCAVGIRNSDNNLRYPEDVVGAEIHDAGRVIAGFHWDALQGLQNAFGQATGTLMTATTWHYGRVLVHPQTQPAQVLGTFMADDDDNDLTNGTPNYAAYCYGAEHHGFSCPIISSGVMMEHLSLDDTDNTAASYAVSVDVTSTEDTIDASTVKVFWRYNDGAWNQVAMTAGGGDTYNGTIPANTYGEVEYYFSAEDNSNNVGTLPFGAPSGVFRYDVAFVADHTESVGGWTVGDDADNATDGFWVNVDPIGTSAQPEDDHTNYGTKCWVTGQHQPGQADDWGDVDGGKTTLFSNAWDLSGAESVNVSWWQWIEVGVGDNVPVKFSNDGGATWITYTTFLADTGGWEQRSANWSSYFASPGQVMVKWTAADLGPETLMEVAIDDLKIIAFFSTGTQGDGIEISFPADLSQNHPNPFNPVTEIKFSIAQAGPVSLKVFDAQGRLVRDLSEGSYQAGEHTVVWNGQDHRGNPVASGVYLYRLEAAGERMSKRMVLIK